ncbi:hypothetical protein KR093_000517, partial [Drosophila rubida]
MPMELFIASIMRPAKWVNMLIVNSSNSKHRRIDVRTDGIRWREKNHEQFSRLGKFFQLKPKTLKIEKEWRDEIAFRLNVTNFKVAALDEVTIHVPVDRLQLQLDESHTFGLQCNNCSNYVMPQRRFSFITQMPMVTMQPRKYFRINGTPAMTLSDGELYYGLNYIVMRQRVLGFGVMRNREHIHCRRCLQLVGEALDELMAVKLYVDTLWVISSKGGDRSQMSEGQLEERFAPLSVSQVMLQLLPNAVPSSKHKSRIFLKAVRADGQLHYMLLLVDVRELRLLRSNQSLSEMFNLNCNVKRTARKGLKANRKGQDACFWPSGESKPKRQRLGAEKTVHEVKVSGYRGCRVNYQIFGNDAQLSANSEVFEQWHAEGTPMLRISYTTMMDLMHELKMNEDLVNKLERSAL